MKPRKWTMPKIGKSIIPHNCDNLRNISGTKAPGCALVAAIYCITPLTLLAADGDWISASNGNWSNPANWQAGGIADGAGHIASFIVDLPQSGVVVTLDDDRSIGGLVFADIDDLTPGKWTIQGGTLTLNDGGSGTLPSISVFGLGDGATATIESNLTGSQRITKTGAGTLVLTGTNSHSGGTTVAAGILQIGDGGADGTLGSNAAAVINAGATLFFNHSGLVAVNTVSGAGNAIQIGGGTVSFNGNNSAAGPSSWLVQDGSTLQGTSASRLPNGLMIFDDGHFTLSSATSLHGTRPLEFREGGGTIRFNNLVRFNTGTGGGGTTNQLRGSGPVTFHGPGAMQLENANNYSGELTVNSGTVRLTHAGGLQNAAAIQIMSGGIVETSNLATWPLGAQQRLSGSGTLNLNAAAGAMGTATTRGAVSPGPGGGTLTVNGNFTFEPDSSLHIGIDPDGVAQVESLVAVGEALADGNVQVTVTGAGIAGSPIQITVAVVNFDSAAVWAGKVRTALANVAAITQFYAVGGAGETITLTRLVGGPNDDTLNIALDNGDPTPFIVPVANSTTSVKGGTGADRLAVSGSLDVSGATLNLTTAKPLTGPAYVIASYNSLTGTFTGINGLPAGYSINYAYQGNKIALVEGGGSPGNTFADWLTANPPATGFNTDSDHDGIPNAIEHILGTNPNVPNVGLTNISATPNSSTFQHTLNPNIASDVIRSYQWSTDLVEWKASGESNSSATTATITPSTPANGVVTVTVTITAGPSARMFSRLVATQAP
jgi:autotransporter-associated beta strand protein